MKFKMMIILGLLATTSAFATDCGWDDQGIMRCYGSSISLEDIKVSAQSLCEKKLIELQSEIHDSHTEKQTLASNDARTLILALNSLSQEVDGGNACSLYDVQLVEETYQKLNK